MSSFSFPAWGTCQKVKSENDCGFLSGGWIKGDVTQKFGKSHFNVKVDFLTMCLLWEIPLVCRLMFFFFSLALFSFCWAWFSYLWKGWESCFHFCQIYYQDEDIHTVNEPERDSSDMCTVCGAKRGRSLQEGGCGSTPSTPFPSYPQPLGAWHKFRSPCTDTQGLSQCDWGIAKLTSDMWRDCFIVFVLFFLCFYFFFSSQQTTQNHLIITLWPLLASPPCLEFEKRR